MQDGRHTIITDYAFYKSRDVSAHSWEIWVQKVLSVNHWVWIINLPSNVTGVVVDDMAATTS